MVDDAHEPHQDALDAAPSPQDAATTDDGRWGQDTGRLHIDGGRGSADASEAMADAVARDASQDAGRADLESDRDATGAQGSIADATTTRDADTERHVEPILYQGPLGSVIFAAFDANGGDAGLTIANDCADIPPGLFEKQTGPCLKVHADYPLATPARVCLPDSPTVNPNLLRCWPAPGVTSSACLLQDGGFSRQSVHVYLIGTKCCEPLAGGVGGSSLACGDTATFDGTIAMGRPFDADHDFVPDYTDNCLGVQNFEQFDDDFDGVGNSCDNCPSVSNPDQADDNGNQVGNACEGSFTRADAAPD